MVVLESHSHSHTHSGSKGGATNQYLQPDYLSPTTLDSKKSPLAMLVQTCSQIGADPPTSKFPSKKSTATSPTQEANSKGSSPPSSQRDRQKSISPPTSLPKTPPVKSPKLVMDDQQDTCSPKQQQQHLKRPRSSSSIASASTISPLPPKQQRLTVTPPQQQQQQQQKEEKKESQSQSQSQAQASPTPTIRSGMEVLNGGQRGGGYPGFHNIPGMYPGGGGGYPSPYGVDPFFMMNPAFRDLRLFPQQSSPYFQGANPYASVAASPYLNPYGGRKPGECKDPYCTSCPPTTMPQMAICPAGCAQCDHQKVPYPFPMYNPPQQQHPQQQHQPPQQLPPTSSASGNSPTPQNQGRPHVCNWIVGDNYCGKRFTNSEELLQHLRSHTSSAASATAAENNAASASAQLALQQHFAASALYSQHPMLHQMQMTNPLAAAVAMQQMQMSMGAAAAGMQMQMPRGFPTSPPISPYGGSAKPGSLNLANYYQPNPYGLFPSRP